MVPALAAVSIAGNLDVPLGEWLLYGLVLGPVTALLTTLLFGLLLRWRRYWDADSDEDVDAAMTETESLDSTTDDTRHAPPLIVSMLPILVPLAMIAFGAFSELGGWQPDWVQFVGNPILALFVGLLGAYALARRGMGTEATGEAMSDGFRTSGEILLITGVGGSLGAVIDASGLDEVLTKLFTADAGLPLVVILALAWTIGAVLHLAIGSVSVAAIAAAGIVGPVIGDLSVSPVVVGLAIASGAMFAVQVNSNFFWMFKGLMGLSTKGALKTLTVCTCLASLVSFPLVVATSLIA